MVREAFLEEVAREVDFKEWEGVSEGKDGSRDGILGSEDGGAETQGRVV